MVFLVFNFHENTHHDFIQRSVVEMTPYVLILPFFKCIYGLTCMGMFKGAAGDRVLLLLAASAKLVECTLSARLGKSELQQPLWCCIGGRGCSTTHMHCPPPRSGRDFVSVDVRYIHSSSTSTCRPRDRSGGGSKPTHKTKKTHAL